MVYVIIYVVEAGIIAAEILSQINDERIAYEVSLLRRGLIKEAAAYDRSVGFPGYAVLIAVCKACGCGGGKMSYEDLVRAIYESRCYWPFVLYSTAQPFG